MHSYRIRPPVSSDAISPREFEQRRQAYEAFLATRRSAMPRDLWSFFAWDTFHDGGLERISFSRSMDVLRMRLTCPNVKKLSPSGDFDFVNVTFDCAFRGVVHLETNKRASRIGLFMGSEIDAEESLLRQADVSADGGCHSLLMEFEWGSLLVLFRSLILTAMDPGAFESMRSDPTYFIPTAP
jgi:hypothetical protein